MNRTRCALLLGLVAVALVVALGSPSSAEMSEWWSHRRPTVVTYLIKDPCALANEEGQVINSVGLREWKVVRWINQSQNPVAIFFEPPIAGRDHIFLNPGDSYVTTFNRVPSKVGDVKISLVCLDPEEGAIAPAPPQPVDCPPDTSKACP